MSEPKLNPKKISQTACKPGFVLAILARDDYSSGMPVTGHLVQPTRTAARDGLYMCLPANGYGHAMRFLFGLAPGGVCHAVPVTGYAVRSYRTFSPFPGREAG